MVLTTDQEGTTENTRLRRQVLRVVADVADPETSMEIRCRRTVPTDNHL